MALRVLEAVGIDPKKDIKQERLGAAESVNAIKDRKIDAFFWVGGVPTAALTDLAATPGIKMKLIDHAEVRRRDEQEIRPALREGDDRRPTATPGRTSRMPTSTSGTSSSSSDKMSDKMAYDIVKTLFEKKPELVAVHKEAENIDLKNQAIARRCRSIPARRNISKNTASRFNERPAAAAPEPSLTQSTVDGRASSSPQGR